MPRKTCNKSLLIISNGGIAYDEYGTAFGNRDTGNLIQNLKDKGNKIRYVSHYGNYKQNKFNFTFNLKENSINYSIIYGKKPKSYFGLIKLAYYLLAANHVYIFYPGGLSKRASKICIILKKKYGVYVRGNGLYISNNNNEKNINQFTFNNTLILKEANYIITVSESLKNTSLKYNSNIELIKPMITWSIKDIYVKELDFSKIDCWKLLFVGNLQELKGISELINTANILDKSGVKFKLTIIGDGILYDDLLVQKQRGYISENVELKGAVTDNKTLEYYYEKSDLFIFPSRNEGFPRVIYEAMLKSLPIFTTMVGGIPGLMKHNYNCIEIPICDPEGIAEVILNALNNPKLLEKITKNGLDTVKEVLATRKPHHEVLISCIDSEKIKS